MGLVSLFQGSVIGSEIALMALTKLLVVIFFSFLLSRFPYFTSFPSSSSLISPCKNVYKLFNELFLA
jgi:uncharacterized RDD family membrane protein YckC